MGYAALVFYSKNFCEPDELWWVRERPTGSERILVFNGVERASDAEVELSFCGSALSQYARLFASLQRLRDARLYRASKHHYAHWWLPNIWHPRFLNVVPAEASIQSGGSAGCSPGPPLSRGRREGDAD
jgi:hypothetical protein